jgi:hypothetical protein
MLCDVPDYGDSPQSLLQLKLMRQAIAWGSEQSDIYVIIAILTSTPPPDFVTELMLQTTRPSVRVACLLPSAIDSIGIPSVSWCVGFESECTSPPATIPVDYSQWSPRNIRMRYVGTAPVQDAEFVDESMLVTFRYQAVQRDLLFTALISQTLASVLFAPSDPTIMQWSCGLLGVLALQDLQITARIYVRRFAVIMQRMFVRENYTHWGAVHTLENLMFHVDASKAVTVTGLGPYSSIAYVWHPRNSADTAVAFLHNQVGQPLAVAPPKRIAALYMTPLARAFINILIRPGRRLLFFEGEHISSDYVIDSALDSETERFPVQSEWLRDPAANVLTATTVAWLNYDTSVDITCIGTDGRSRLWRCRRTTDVPVQFVGTRVTRISVFRDTAF